MKPTLTLVAVVACAWAAFAAPMAMAADLYACVAIFDVKASDGDRFQSELLQSNEAISTQPGLIAERILRNIDPLTNQFALYSRFETLGQAEERCGASLRPFASMLQRAPETHVAQVEKAYDRGGRVGTPHGLEFGAGRVGQIAHLGLFLPFAEHRAEYDRILDLVKMDTSTGDFDGFLGEELLSEVSPASVEAQSPYTPRAKTLVPMSINYGEFVTLEDAENAYIRRGEDHTGDPVLKYWYRAFFGALQVPHRFYIFEVVGNAPNSRQLAEMGFEDGSKVASLSKP